MPDKLSTEEIKKRLKVSLKTICLDTTDSTNNEAKRLLENGEGAPFLIAARRQTAGRGRQGKSFYSPKDTGLYMSLCLPADEASDGFLAVTSAAAVAVCRAIESLTDTKPMIKWVNDIYLGGRKICGILCEHIEDCVIIGIGINLTTRAFPNDVRNAGSLGFDNANALAAEVVNQLFAIKGGYGDFIDYYKSRFMLTGREIAFIRNGEELRGLALGADGRCGLIVRLSSGEDTTLTSGEVSVVDF